MVNGRKKLFFFRRDDITTFLVVAFLFQFLAPAAVLSYGDGLDEEYLQLLRDSICRAEAPDTQDPQKPIQQIPGVACDLCVLHAGFSLPGVLPAFDVDELVRQQTLSVVYEKAQLARLSTQARGNLSPSRAPPSL